MRAAILTPGIAPGSRALAATTAAVGMSHAVILVAPLPGIVVAEPALYLVAGAVPEAAVIVAAAAAHPALVIASIAVSAASVIPIVSHANPPKRAHAWQAGVPAACGDETSSRSGLFRLRKGEDSRTEQVRRRGEKARCQRHKAPLEERSPTGAGL
jgi:hypothetical protein